MSNREKESDRTYGKVRAIDEELITEHRRRNNKEEKTKTGRDRERRSGRDR